jgi:hypothetical protein
MYEAEPKDHMPRNNILPAPGGIKPDEQLKQRAAEAGHVCYVWSRRDITGDGQEDYHLLRNKAYGFRLVRFYAAMRHGCWNANRDTGLPTDAQVSFLNLSGRGRLGGAATSRETGGVFLGYGTVRFQRGQADRGRGRRKGVTRRSADP